jgi:hypothetical protein
MLFFMEKEHHEKEAAGARPGPNRPAKKIDFSPRV